MGHRLVSTEQSPRLLSELLSKLQAAFLLVEADQARGAAHVDDMMVHLKKVRAGYERWKTPPPESAEIDATLVRLESLRSSAVFITVAESKSDPDRSVSFNWVPGEDLIIGYANFAHESSATAITMQIADAIEYDRAPL